MLAPNTISGRSSRSHSARIKSHTNSTQSSYLTATARGSAVYP